MMKTTFTIAKMDCPAEEQLVRISLDGIPSISVLNFDLSARKLEVFHTGDSAPIVQALDSLRLDTTTSSSAETDEIVAANHGAERKALLTVLVINLSFFVTNLITGFIAGSMGLIADSLDMLADSFVFALSLFAVGGTIMRKKKVARVSGYLQLALALFGLVEVTRRFLGLEEVPQYQLMIIVSGLALIGNAASIYILQKARSKEAHMQASYIFLSNDVAINFGVILAGVFVYFTASKFPDLIIGSLIFLIVARGAFRILQVAK
ncbi:MAG: cation transporter [Pyrinomonadaceae bacterium]